MEGRECAACHSRWLSGLLDYPVLVKVSDFAADEDRQQLGRECHANRNELYTGAFLPSEKPSIKVMYYKP